jgi:hypothetical protein
MSGGNLNGTTKRFGNELSGSEPVKNKLRMRRGAKRRNESDRIWGRKSANRIEERCFMMGDPHVIFCPCAMGRVFLFEDWQLEAAFGRNLL